MADKQKRQTPPRLKCAFDTSVLTTETASDLLRREARDIIQRNSGHADLIVEWYLPEIVMHERQFQMINRGLELLPPIKKLERLLGHNLNITEDIVKTRVRNAVESQLEELGVEVLPLDMSRVDWTEVMMGAAYRKPPSALRERKGSETHLLLKHLRNW